MSFSETGGESLMDGLVGFLKAAGWHYQIVEPGALIRASARSEHGTWVVYLRADESSRRVVCHTLMDLNIPTELRPRVLEYLSRVNYQLPLGSFDMDVDSGDIRFKTGAEVPAGLFSTAAARALATAGVHASERYFSGVLAVVYSGLSPTAALARVENLGVTEE